MTMRKKIIFSNILMVVLPIALILMIWVGYVHWGNGAYLKPINRALDGGDMLTEAMNVLYTYEAELSDMHWDVAAFPGENGIDIVVYADWMWSYVLQIPTHFDSERFSQRPL